MTGKSTQVMRSVDIFMGKNLRESQLARDSRNAVPINIHCSVQCISNPFNLAEIMEIFLASISCRGTEGFIIRISNATTGPWIVFYNGTLEDPRPYG